MSSVCRTGVPSSANPGLNDFTFGGGQYLVNVFNAVAAWCGGGGFRSAQQAEAALA